MRLIDADALTREVCVKFYTTPYYKHILDLIYNAPTVNTEDCEGCPYCPNSNSGIPIGVE